MKLNSLLCTVLWLMRGEWQMWKNARKVSLNQLVTSALMRKKGMQQYWARLLPVLGALTATSTESINNHAHTILHSTRLTYNSYWLNFDLESVIYYGFVPLDPHNIIYNYNIIFKLIILISCCNDIVPKLTVFNKIFSTWLTQYVSCMNARFWPLLWISEVEGCVHIIIIMTL